jgi:predicted signal transduction protein with EAL and GGDEF domain
VARFGGDEFVVLCESITGPEDAELLATTLLGSLSVPMAVDGTEIALSASIGIAVAEGHASANDLLRDADTALHVVKSRGGAGFELFHLELQRRARERWEIEHDLRHALRRGELRVFYQPQIDIETGAVVAVEALVRWQHPTRGLLSPAAFVFVAEETGLIREIGTWVLREACRQSAAWQQEGRRPRISVNVSPRQLDADLAYTVESALAETGIEPDCLCLEFTENTLIDTNSDNLAMLESLRSRGVSIALDDFGIGYSSLGMLRSLPVDVLKIDRSLVADIEHRQSAAITTAVIELTRALDITAVAEGVEEETQLAALHGLACPFVQGYLFARPEPAERVRWHYQVPEMHPG